jgi:hypothetical protein
MYAMWTKHSKHKLPHLKHLHGEFYCTEKVLVNGLELGGLAQHRGGPAALKKKKIKFPHQEIQNRAVAKSYMTRGLLMYRKILAHFLIY